MELLERWLVAIHHLLQCCLERLAALTDERIKQLLFVVEIIIHRTLTGIGKRDDFVHRRPVITLAGKDGVSGFKNLLALGA